MVRCNSKITYYFSPNGYVTLIFIYTVLCGKEKSLYFAEIKVDGTKSDFIFLTLHLQNKEVIV
jgi:hypothetical protein